MWAIQNSAMGGGTTLFFHAINVIFILISLITLFLLKSRKIITYDTFEC